MAWSRPKSVAGKGSKSSLGHFLGPCWRDGLAYGSSSIPTPCLLSKMWHLLLLPLVEATLRGFNSTGPRRMDAPPPLAEMLQSSSSHLVWSPDHSYCLSSDANRIGEGVKIQLWKCDDAWYSGGQNFFLERPEGAGRIRMRQDPAFCLAIKGGEYRNGARIEVARCDDANEHQMWSLSGALKPTNAPDMCLVINYNRAFNGAKIQLWRCNYEADQTWSLISLGSSQTTAFMNPAARCEGDWSEVTSTAQCEEAARALQPVGDTCFDSVSPWRASTEYLPTCHGGCFWWSACQGCGKMLGFNQMAGVGPCPLNGECWSGLPICQRRIR